MTIDSTWIQALKREVPIAFSPSRPFGPRAIFIDGQIKLNTPLLDHTQTWDEYFERQFVHLINKYFQLPTVECIILAFDDYHHVPHAKSMTQCKRRKHVPSVEFADRDCLPPTVPKGQDWISHLCNRTFKLKLIQAVIYYVVTHTQMSPHQRLIIDYMNFPKRYNHLHEFEEMTEMEPLGEADVKFPRYASLYSKLQIDSIDGDNVPIALLYLQKMESMHFINRVCIYRMKTMMDEDKVAKPEKRKTAEKKPGRQYEYVDLNVLYQCLILDILPQCVDRAILPRVQGKEITLLCVLIGLTGTDFTRKLTGVTGRTLYDFLPYLWLRLSMVLDSSGSQVRVRETVDQVLSGIYKAKFNKHIKAEHPAAFDEVLDDLHKSKLSDKFKTTLQTRATLECTVQNINWLLLYWNAGTYPDPVQEEYGYKRTKTGAIDYIA